ncbi:hypothetical protein, partial [Bacillus cereus]
FTETHGRDLPSFPFDSTNFLISSFGSSNASDNQSVTSFFRSSVKVIGHFNKSKRLSPLRKIAFYDADDTLSPITPNTIKRIQ